MVDTFFLASYAVGGIVLGQLADRYSAKALIVVLYTVIAIITASLGLMMFIPND